MKEPKKSRSIQTLLSTYFLLFSVILLTLTAVIVSLIQFRATRDDAVQTLQQTSLSIADSVDQQINQMNQISLNAISSSDLKETFVRYYSEGLSAYERQRLHLHLADSLITAKGFDFSIRQVNLYATDRKGFGIGEENGDLDADAPSLSWYDGALRQNGRFVVTADDGYISLARLFYNNINVPIGFVEVKKYYDTVFSLAEDPRLSYPVTIVVYDENGSILYPPSEEGADLFDYYSYAGQEKNVLVNTNQNRKEYVSFAVSDKNGLVIAVTARRSVFLRQIFLSMRWIFSGIILGLAVLLLLSVMLSRRISFPIRHIYHFLADETKEQFRPLEMEHTGIREIDKLIDSINENIKSTRTATDTMMILREKEVQAQMLALQSQMNPHFLYNALSTIGEMAQEGMTEPVARMCDQITEIMRYISSTTDQRSTLEEELEICDMYLDCLRMRYGDSLKSRIEVPDELLEVKIPKLCIQLLVENAVRSVTTAAPPWQVDVSCRIEGENWTVTVSDNGPGFDPEVDRQLRSRMDQILATGTLPGLQIQGMGILNIFIRLYLLDGIPFIFDMGDREGGGAFVTIGGRI